VLFAEFATSLQKLESISSRLEITAVLAEVFTCITPAETPAACYLLQGQLLPQYQGLELQISVKTVIKALEKLSPNSVDQQILERYHQLGDLGKVAEEVLADRSRSEVQLTVSVVHERLLVIANESGAQSQQRKLDGLVDLLADLDAVSAKFVVRIVLGRLRLGFSDMTMIDALSWAMTGGKSERDQIELAFQKRADIGQLAQAYLSQSDSKERLEQLQNYTVELGIPIVPALCQRLNSAAEMIEKMGEVIAEPKYDGLRVQIHVNKDASGEVSQVRTFTRNLEETSHMFPELQTALKDLDCQSCILDAEAIGYDPKTGDLISFQQTMQRKRKHDVAEKAKEIPVRFFVFDLLYLDGQELLQTPLAERKKLLHSLFKDTEVLYHSPELKTTDAVELREYHEKNLAEGLEGVVVKQLSAAYQSGRKGWSWVKMKEAEGRTGKLLDTLDVVIMGYYYGRGKRTEFGIGAFLVGIVDAEGTTVLTIAKIGTGLSDETLKVVKTRCTEVTVSEKPASYEVGKLVTPDVWCEPSIVVEVAADELTVSPLHSAGFALRFPRFIQFRDDKKWQQATGSDELRQLQGK